MKVKPCDTSASIAANHWEQLSKMPEAEQCGWWRRSAEGGSWLRGS
ncbi:MAG: hypothetical protein ACYC1E_18400 [Propionibacteriaceae bacterium]